MSTQSNRIYELIAGQGWDAGTATELVLDYLRQRGTHLASIDVLVAGVTACGGAEGLLSFLQDCVMTGIDREVEANLRRLKGKSGPRADSNPTPARRDRPVKLSPPATKVCRLCKIAKRRAAWTCRSCGALCCEHLCRLKAMSGGPGVPTTAIATCGKCLR